MIARIFLDDGNRDAWDDDNNYICFNGNDKETESVVMNILKDKDLSKPEIRRLLHDVCASSFNTPSSCNRNNKSFRHKLLSIIYNIISYPN